MPKTTAILVILLFVGQGLAGAATVTSFSDGKTEAIVLLAGPMYTDRINLSLPADCLVKKATMDVSSVLPDANNPECPEKVQVFFNDTLVWQFDGQDYGPFGKQDSFVGGMEQWTARFNSTGNQTRKVRLMKDATVMRANLDVNVSGNDFSGTMSCISGVYAGANLYDMFGLSDSGAGDVNGDGYDDILVGTLYPPNSINAGKVFLYYGGGSINKTPELVFVGPQDNAYLGEQNTVSGAGDLNADGYDDIILSARGLCETYIFLGGPQMDNRSDYTLTDLSTPNSSYGCTVSGAGDVNGDGYDDVIVGALLGGPDADGAAYIYFGGQSINKTPDKSLFGEHHNFGFTVSGAGDVNGDGYSDVIIGAQHHDANGVASGKVFVYFGGKDMDTTPDASMVGLAAGLQLGLSVSGAGDVNGDGYDDVIAGAQGGDVAYVLYGGKTMNSTPDLILYGDAQTWFGHAVSGAGDVNKDGFDDVIVGEISYCPQVQMIGRVFIYFGGARMDNIADIIIDGRNTDDGDGESLGFSVANAGDVDKDGFDELIMGAPCNDSGGSDTGVSYLYYPGKGERGIRAPYVTIGSKLAWEYSGLTNRSISLQNFPSNLNDFLRAATPDGTDDYGNAYVDVPITVGASSAGNITLGNLSINYSYRRPLVDFAKMLNDYIIAHKLEKDPNGNITIPIKLVASSPGRVKLLNLDIALDDAPRLVQKIPDAQLAEDTAKAYLFDVRAYFKDDYDAPALLNLSVVSATNESFVKVGIADNQYLSADATVGPGNWTGEASVVVRCADSQNHSRNTNEFRIVVFNVNDPPVFISNPLCTAVAGEAYSYQAMAVDGDNDPMTFNLSKKPLNMTVDSATGPVSWVPQAGGAFEVNIEVSDGQVKNFQNYIIKVGYRPPRITNTTIPEARAGVPFVYDIPAVSDDGRDLNFRMLNTIEGLTIDSSSGRLTWTPKDVGDYPVSVNISDGKASTIYNFTIHVVKGNKAPIFASSPAKTAYIGIPYSYEAMATDGDNDTLSFGLDKGPAGMTIDASSGKIAWTPAAAGNQTVRIKVADGRGGEAFQEFVVTVLEPVKAKVQFTVPSESQKVKGKLAVTGSAVKGTLDIVKVQFRVDAGDWTDVSGNTTWSYTLDTTKLKNGKHTLQARAYDGMDYSDTVIRTVTVDNQKAAGKGFIPGFAGIAVPMAAAAAFVIFGRKRKTGG